MEVGAGRDALGACHGAICGDCADGCACGAGAADAPLNFCAVHVDGANGSVGNFCRVNAGVAEVCVEDSSI